MQHRIDCNEHDEHEIPFSTAYAVGRSSTTNAKYVSWVEKILALVTRQLEEAHAAYLGCSGDFLALYWYFAQMTRKVTIPTNARPSTT